MTIARFTILFAVLAASPAPGHAGVFKCAAPAGQVIYQDAPCAAGQELRDFDRDPATVSVVPFAAAPTSPRAEAAPRPTVRSGRAPRVATDGGRPRATAKSRKPVATGDAHQRRYLRPGMSEGEVRARVGPPDLTAGSGAKGMRWTYMPVPDDANTITTLVFEHGKLSDVERKVIR